MSAPKEVSKVDVLAEIEDVIRNMPPRGQFDHDDLETLSWLGRAVAAIGNWSLTKGLVAGGFISDLHSTNSNASRKAEVELIILLNQARHDLRLNTLGPVDVAVGQGLVFDYFDEIRKQIALARTDLFFVDPYLDADFVSRYLPHVVSGVSVRLLGREKMSTLRPAVTLFAEQSGTKVEVKSASGFHDRYMFVDNSACFHSGASFKDGGKTAPTTITQIVDAFDAVRKTYEEIWARAT